MKSLVVFLTSCTWLATCVPPPHPDALAVKHEEDLLPPALKSPAWRNPHLLNILPLTSLLHDGENLVTEREANKIPKIEIYKVLTHAGLLPRKALPPGFNHKLNKIPIAIPGKLLANNFYGISDWESQVLQYL